MKTKFNLKILLLVSILLIAMCLFNTNMVQATEVITDETTKADTTNTPQVEQKQEVMGNYTLCGIPEDWFNRVVPNTIEITKTKTEFVNTLIKNDDSFIKTEKEIETEVKTKILDLFKNTAGVVVENGEEDLIKVQMDNPMFDFYTIRVSLNATEYGKEYSKNTTIKYAKESNFSATDETYVKNAVKNIKFAKYSGDSYWGIEESDAVFTMYNVGDETNASKWTENTYNFSKLLNDNSITVKTSMFAGGMGGGTPWGVPMLLHFYKNGVLYETKSIWNLGAYGITLENGTPVNMAKLEKDDEIYKTMAKELNNRGLTNILGAYELTAYGTTYDNMKVSFNLGNDYNGKEVQILHKKKNNTYELLKTTVAEGKATITVNEFSPFMIALSNTTNTNNTNDPTSDKKLDDEPKTGVADYTIFASILAIISLGGIITLKFKK